MDRLKSALYEAEDVLDLVDYRLTQKRVTGHGPVGAWIASWAPVQHLKTPHGDPISHRERSCFDQWRRRIASWVQQCLRGAAGTLISGCKSCFRRSIDTVNALGVLHTGPSSSPHLSDSSHPSRAPGEQRGLSSADAVSTAVPVQDVSKDFRID